jgi:small-conductance mechanosensitive channel
MDIQERINLAIYDRFNEEGIEFAFPTQTIVQGRLLPHEGDPATRPEAHEPEPKQGSGSEEPERR